MGGQRVLERKRRSRDCRVLLCTRINMTDKRRHRNPPKQISKVIEKRATGCSGPGTERNTSTNQFNTFFSANFVIKAVHFVMTGLFLSY